MPVPALAARPWQITNANVEPCGGISPCKTPSGNRQPVIRRIMRVSFNQPRRIEFLTQVRESVGLMGRIPRRNKTEFEINSVSSAQGVIVVGLYEIFASENSEIQRALILSTILPFDCCVDVVVVANYPFQNFYSPLMNLRSNETFVFSSPRKQLPIHGVSDSRCTDRIR